MVARFATLQKVMFSMSADPDAWTVLLLGVVEGLTEFLPVSSTGHLILAGELLGHVGEESKSFRIAVQLGAILAVLVAYREQFLRAGVGVLRREEEALRFARNILIGFLPAILVGVIAYDAVRAMLGSPEVVAAALVAGGAAMLWLERRMGPGRFGKVEAIPPRRAVTVGVLQCFAMVPGVSRSGASILGALAVGVERRTAAEFSFFLAVPTMIAATTYDLYRNRRLLGLDQLGDILLGGAAAFVTALLVVKAFVALVSRHGFAPFAWYRIAAGSVALVWWAVR
jgi:undecaprenyl-diphosphatase